MTRPDRPDLGPAWACDRAGAGRLRGGVRAGTAWRAVSARETRAAVAARRCDRGWRGEEGSWASKRRCTCAVGDMDRASAVGRNSGGEGSAGSWDRRAREGNHDRAVTGAGWGIGTGRDRDMGGGVGSRKSDRTLPLSSTTAQHTSNQNLPSTISTCLSVFW